MIASWQQFQHATASDRTPLERMLPRSIGSIGSLKRTTGVLRDCLGDYEENRSQEHHRIVVMHPRPVASCTMHGRRWRDRCTTV